jgi:hypothetical protein
MNLKIKTMLKKTAAGAVALVGSASAMAQAAPTVDTAPITAAGTSIAAVGAAVFAVYVGIKLYKWIRQAL